MVDAAELGKIDFTMPREKAPARLLKRVANQMRRDIITMLAEAGSGRTGAVVTAEEHLLRGRLGSAVAAVLGRRCPVPLECVGIDDQFGQSGDPEELFKFYGLSASHVALAARRAMDRRG
jgi:transketolase